MRKWWLALMIVALLASACGGSDSVTDIVVDGANSSDDGSDGGDSDGDDTGSDDDGVDGNEPADDDPDDEGEDEPDTDFSGSGSGDFCETAREFEENDPLEDVSFGDAEFFDTADEVWNGILPSVPDEIRPDVETIIANFGQMREIAEKYDYSFLTDEALAELDDIDTTDMEAASARFDAYLEDVCGITSFSSDGDDVPAIDLDDLTDAQITTSASIIAQVFGVDMETAECLVTEFGDLNDPGAIDFARLDEPVCGTTLNELFAGAG